MAAARGVESAVEAPGVAAVAFSVQKRRKVSDEGDTVEATYTVLEHNLYALLLVVSVEKV